MEMYQVQLQQEIAEHNELANNIQAGEAQLADMKADKARRLGRIQMLQEVLDDANKALDHIDKLEAEAKRTTEDEFGGNVEEDKPEDDMIGLDQ